mmetsp:Transcript_20216/g.38115  ORF Transcript_20216/g.38115 Transcript_20216/m.38115 type:complete len:87 (-) Transcript_20216:981-1241(-)
MDINSASASHIRGLGSTYISTRMITSSTRKHHPEGNSAPRGEAALCQHSMMVINPLSPTYYDATYTHAQRYMGNSARRQTVPSANE